MAQDSLSLVGKVAIVTGSGRENGIGAGIALALARAGAKVTINYVSDTTTARAQQVVKNIEAAAGKGSVASIQADVSTAEGNKKLVEGTLKAFGVDHIDILGTRSDIG
jgi:NAD(P)-dependent dehydrogenase (short-subunit alcohol dehydrogenase family)